MEVKCTERFNIYDAMDQAARDAGGASRTGHQKTPFVMHKRNFRRWLVVMEAETFFEFVSGRLPPEEVWSREQGAGGEGANRTGDEGAQGTEFGDAVECVPTKAISAEDGCLQPATENNQQQTER
jgi:hypothetical protein